MARLRCKTCLGEYDDVQPDGMRYFHACAPVTDAQTGVTTERANKRDENVTPGIVNGQVCMVIKSAGAGVVTL